MNRTKGFTLVEAAVAIGVVAILSGIIIPLVLKNVRDARNARARSDIKVIAGAIASQLKDTGSRPTAAGGPGGSTGAADAIWFSGGQSPTVGGVNLLGGAPEVNNTLGNLLAVAGNGGNPLFNLMAVAGPGRAQYRGPYLGTDMAQKSDPWGRAYLVLGYNEAGQASNGPIWVISAGEAGTIAMNNVVDPAAGGNVHPPAWDYTLAGSETNIAVRVN
ncbi:MAG: prepilin-type N-terminal cleavage/methylation domain-containing protein [Holophaga sp.]|nr:prepilin-type N-terminal cleavage/methylation domain-containing protein [Holophaga sp.]